MPTVTIKGVGDVTFPDTMSQADIASAIETQILPNHKPASMGATFLNALPKGAAGLVDSITNAPENVWNLSKMAFGAGATALGRPDLAQDVTPPPTRAADLLRKAGIIRDAAEPTTFGGRVVDMTGQTLGGGGLNPAAIGRAAVRGTALPIVRDLAAATGTGVGAGVGSELARNVDTGNESLDTAIKAGATLIGGGVGGLPLAARGTAGDRAAAATAGLTPAQIAAAIKLQNQAKQAGVPLTGYESIQGITGLNPKMQTQQRVVEQSDAAGKALTPMMQARPGGNQALFDRTVEGISPSNPLPDTLAGTLQLAAKKSIDAARAEGNVKASPFYAKSSNDPTVTIPSGDWNAIASDPAVAWALEQTKKNPLLGVQGAQPGSVQWLDAAKKFLDSKGQALAQSGDRFPAGQASAAAQRITATIDPLVPAYAKARSIIADNMRNNVEPMEASQVGKLSRSDEFAAQGNTLLPQKPLDVTPQVIDRTAKTINAQDPNIMRQFVAQFLRGNFNESNQANIGGANVFGGSKFAAQVAGNSAQEANLMQALKSAGANPEQTQVALQIFRAQGMKPTVNSATTANATEGGLLNGGKLADFATRPWRAIPGLLDNWRNGWAGQGLSGALSDENSIERIMELSRTNGRYNPTQQQVMRGLLNATPGN